MPSKPNVRNGWIEDCMDWGGEARKQTFAQSRLSRLLSIHFGNLKPSSDQAYDVWSNTRKIKVLEIGSLSQGTDESVTMIDPSLNEVKHYKKMYDRVSSMASIGVWEYDLLNHVLWWSDAIYDLFELPRGTPISRALAVSFYDAHSLSKMEALREEAIECGGTFNLDIEVQTSRGERKWINLSAKVEQEDGVSIRIFGTKQDITERKMAQKRLRLLQINQIHLYSRNAMGGVVAALAHELNQPLAAISNYVSGIGALLRATQISEELAFGLKEIDANVFRTAEIIRRMRSMVAKGRGNTETFDISDLLEDAIALARRGNPNTVFNLVFEHSGSVVADPVQIRQVATNIIRNASEALGDLPRGEVLLKTHDDGNFIVVTITDNGSGLPTGLRLFEPIDSTKPDGMGIGLSLCRTIVEANGGKIWFTDSSVGASFSFSLPRVDRPYA